MTYGHFLFWENDGIRAIMAKWLRKVRQNRAAI
jgi:hypothetical protein